MTDKTSTSDTAAAANLRTISARGRLYGMKVQYNGLVWTVLDRHPEKGCWWIHRRDDAGNYMAHYARYSELEQVIE